MSPGGSWAARQCPFCDQAGLAPRLVAELGDFRIVSDSYPLVRGHVLIVTRDHFTSMAALGVQRRAELARVIRKVSGRLRPLGRWIVVFERGNFKRNTSGNPSVDHAHVHLVPLRSPLIVRDFPSARPCYASDWHKRLSQSSYWILQRLGLGRAIKGDAASLRSQAIREAVGSAVGNPKWNWRDRPRSVADRIGARNNTMALRKILL